MDNSIWCKILKVNQTILGHIAKGYIHLEYKILNFIKGLLFLDGKETDETIF